MHSPWPKAPLLLALYTGVLLYGTLSPFHFTWRPGRDSLSRRSHIEWIPFSRLCPSHKLLCPQDTGLNFAMFIPLGALAALVGTKGRPLRRLAGASVFGFALSLLIETSQYFIPARFPSTTDLLLNTLGAAFGGLMFAVMFRNQCLNRAQS